jgi:hypothetical protein
VLYQVQSDYLATRTTKNRDRLNAVQDALTNVFGRMNAQIAAKQFEFANDIAHSHSPWSRPRCARRCRLTPRRCACHQG